MLYLLKTFFVGVRCVCVKINLLSLKFFNKQDGVIYIDNIYDKRQDENDDTHFLNKFVQWCVFCYYLKIQLLSLNT